MAAADSRLELPELPPLATWQDTCTTLHMWTQVAGKVRLVLSPDINHGWGSTLYVTTRGLTTSPIPYGSFSFAIDFDFIEHVLRITTSQGKSHTFPLEPMSVAVFYRKAMQALRELGIEIKIFARPVEVEVAVPFEIDEQHSSYDAGAVGRYWQALVWVDRILKEFRARFIGKVSPVHFFLGWIRSCSYPFFRANRPQTPRWRAQCRGSDNGGSVFSRSIQRGVLAWDRPGGSRILRLRLSHPWGFRHSPRSARGGVFPR